MASGGYNTSNCSSTDVCVLEVSLLKLDGRKVALTVHGPQTVRALKKHLEEKHGFPAEDVHLALLESALPLADDHTISGSSELSFWVSGDSIEVVLTEALPAYLARNFDDGEDDVKQQRDDFQKCVALFTENLASEGLLTLGQLRKSLAVIPTRRRMRWWKSKAPEIDEDKVGLVYVDWDRVSCEFARRVLTPRVIPDSFGKATTTSSYVPYPGQPKDDVIRCAAVRAEKQKETLKTVWIFRPELGLCRAVACEDWTHEPVLDKVLPSREKLNCRSLDIGITPPGSMMDPEDYLETVEGFGRASWTFEELEPNPFDLSLMSEDEADDFWKPQIREAKETKSKIETLMLSSTHRPGIPSSTLRFLFRCQTDKGETPHLFSEELDMAVKSGMCKGGGKGKDEGKEFKGIEAKCVSIDEAVQIEKPKGDDDEEGDEDEDEGVEWKSAATFQCKSVEDAVSAFMHYFPHQRRMKYLTSWQVELVSFLPEAPPT